MIISEGQLLSDRLSDAAKVGTRPNRISGGLFSAEFGMRVAPEALAEVIAGIRAFASPILIALTDNSRPPDRWHPRKGWV